MELNIEQAIAAVRRDQSLSIEEKMGLISKAKSIRIAFEKLVSEVEPRRETSMKKVGLKELQKGKWYWLKADDPLGVFEFVAMDELPGDKWVNFNRFPSFRVENVMEIYGPIETP